MRVFVTGVTGFIGTHFCRQLLGAGHEVLGLVRTPSKLAGDLSERIQVMRGDLSLFDDPHLELPEVDVVVHLAAVIAGKTQKEYAEVNYDAVERMLTALRAQKWTPRRVLFASSLAAAGPSGSEPLDENDEPHPVDAYGRAKLAAEALMKAQPFPTTSFRPSIVLGAGDPATLTLYRMASSGVAVLPGFGEQMLSFVSVNDLVDAMILMSEDASEQHRVLFVAANDVTSNDELIRSIAAAMDRSVRVLRVPKSLVFVGMLASTGLSKLTGRLNQLDLKQYQQMTAPAFVCSSDRIQNELGWRPKDTLDATLREAVDGYRALGQLPA